MSKRAHESAFTSSTPGGVLGTADGFGAPQPQVQQYTSPSTISSPSVPGQWPLEAEPDEAPSAFYMVGRWAATALITNLAQLPRRLVQRFGQRQCIKAVLVIREDGSSKKRFVDAGLSKEPLTPSPVTRARANLSRSQFLTRATAPSPSTWPPSPSPSPRESRQISSPSPTPPQFTSPLALALVGEELQSISPDGNIDDSLDFSFSEVLTSTPPRNFYTGSPTPLSWDSPKIRSPAGETQSDATPPLQKRFKGLSSGSNGSGRHQSDLPPVTPMRRHLLKLQLRAQGEQRAQEEGSAETEIAPVHPTEPVDEEYLPDASSSPFQIDVSSPFKEVVSSSPFQADVSSSPFQEVVSSSPFQEIVSSSPFQSVVDSSPFQSNVSSSPPHVYENDLSFLEDASPLPQGKRVRWAQHAGARSFYVDEKVSEMLDSTLETITSSPIRPSWEYYDDEEDEDVSEDESPDASLHSEPSEESQPETQKVTSTEDGSFHGVPDDTSDGSEDSIDESQISVELLEDLQHDLKKKLALAPPTPPTVEPLIAPLSETEKQVLDTAASEANNGADPTAFIVPDKLDARDFGTLLPWQFNGDPKAWLNDNIVNEYLTILVKHKKEEMGYEHKRGGPAPPIHAFSSFWYSTAKVRIKAVERWAARFQLAGKQFLDADLLLYPICDGGHWRLLAIKPKDRIIEYLDSLGFTGKPYITKALEYLELELKEDYIAEEWTVIEKQRSSRQLNGSDCGVFTLLNALVLMRGDETHRVIACEGMADARERIAATLIKGRPTTEMI